MIVFCKQKYQTTFWKIWKAKFTSKAWFSDFIDDFNDAPVIADAFACMFEGACVNNSSENNKRLFCEFTTTQDEYFFSYKYNNHHNVYISVEYVDKCLHAVKLGKAAGCDGIETEHMVNAHPILVYSCRILYAMLQWLCC